MFVAPATKELPLQCLSDTSIRQAKPHTQGRKLFDGGGLFLLISPTGGKWWRLKYRFGGKEKLISLGVYPDVGLKLARERFVRFSGGWVAAHAETVIHRLEADVFPWIGTRPIHEINAVDCWRCYGALRRGARFRLLIASRESSGK